MSENTDDEAGKIYPSVNTCDSQGTKSFWNSNPQNENMIIVENNTVADEAPFTFCGAPVQDEQRATNRISTGRSIDFRMVSSSFNSVSASDLSHARIGVNDEKFHAISSLNDTDETSFLSQISTENIVATKTQDNEASAYNSSIYYDCITSTDDSQNRMDKISVRSSFETNRTFLDTVTQFQLEPLDVAFSENLCSEGETITNVPHNTQSDPFLSQSGTIRGSGSLSNRPFAPIVSGNLHYDSNNHVTIDSNHDGKNDESTTELDDEKTFNLLLAFTGVIDRTKYVHRKPRT
jgi:hypothetical protein